MYILNLFWFTKIIAGLLSSLGIENLTYQSSDIVEQDDSEDEKPMKGKKQKKN